MAEFEEKNLSHLSPSFKTAGAAPLSTSTTSGELNQGDAPPAPLGDGPASTPTSNPTTTPPAISTPTKPSPDGAEHPHRPNSHRPSPAAGKAKVEARNLIIRALPGVGVAAILWIIGFLAIIALVAAAIGLGGQSLGLGGDSGGGVAPDGGGVNGSIVETAKKYAWTTSGHGPNESDAKPSYVVAEKKYDPETSDSPFSDCGVFVATVMRASGVDTNYYPRGVENQWNYVKSHPQQYQTFEGITNTSQLRPGDILFSNDINGHTSLYIGPQPSGDPFAGSIVLAASLHGHVPQISIWYGRMGRMARHR